MEELKSLLLRPPIPQLGSSKPRGRGVKTLQSAGSLNANAGSPPLIDPRRREVSSPHLGGRGWARWDFRSAPKGPFRGDARGGPKRETRSERRPPSPRRPPARGWARAAGPLALPSLSRPPRLSPEAFPSGGAGGSGSCAPGGFVGRFSGSVLGVDGKKARALGAADGRVQGNVRGSHC